MKTALKKTWEKLPNSIKDSLRDLRAAIDPPRNDDNNLHGYLVTFDPDEKRRLNLILPSVAPGKVFGGVSTGLELVARAAVLANVELRLILDDFEPETNYEVAFKIMEGTGLDRSRISILRRDAQTPAIPVRKDDVFFVYNWWITLNARALVSEQARLHDRPLTPLVYLVQDYEPGFYAFSSSHLLALRALSPGVPCWAIINSSELDQFVQARGHRFEETFIFDPRLNASLKAALEAVQPRPAKQKKVLVYGRPGIPRNCYLAVIAGLKAFIAEHPEHADWEFVSAGMPHRPVPLGRDRFLTSLGKLSLAEYARTLAQTGVGISLMASPHPSYPPLEMANFGLMTVTNGYECKDLSTSHENIISAPDIEAHTLATCLSQACARVEADPLAGWRGRNLRDGYLEPKGVEAMSELVQRLEERVWG